MKTALYPDRSSTSAIIKVVRSKIHEVPAGCLRTSRELVFCVFDRPGGRRLFLKNPRLLQGRYW